MPVAIDEMEVESATAAPQSSASPREPSKPDPGELERALHARRERLERVRAH